MGNQQRGKDFSLTAKGTLILPPTLHKHVSSPASAFLPIIILCWQLTSPDQHTRTLSALITSFSIPGLSAQGHHASFRVRVVWMELLHSQFEDVAT